MAGPSSLYSQTILMTSLLSGDWTPKTMAFAFLSDLSHCSSTSKKNFFGGGGVGGGAREMKAELISLYSKGDSQLPVS